jgi:hypothetical protein
MKKPKLEALKKLQLQTFAIRPLTKDELKHAQGGDQGRTTTSTCSDFGCP